MIGLRTNICSNNSCEITISDITGFKDVNNPTGFFKPGVDTALLSKEYYIDDVYLITYIIKNNPDGTFTNIVFEGNAPKLVTFDDAKTFLEMVEEAGVNQTAALKSDGYFSIYHLAIPKSSIRETARASAANKYFVNETTKEVFFEDTDEDVTIDLLTLLLGETSWKNTNISIIKTEIVSKCFLDACLSYILEKFAKQYRAGSCTKNNEELSRLKETRDLLFAISNTIQYYVEFGFYYKAAKLISDVSFCSICATFIKNTTTNCNCND